MPAMYQEEATEYEPRKSFKKGPESQSWQAAAACLAKGVCNLSVQDKQNSVRFGAATIIGE